MQTPTKLSLLRIVLEIVLFSELIHFKYIVPVKSHYDVFLLDYGQIIKRKVIFFYNLFLKKEDGNFFSTLVYKNIKWKIT